MKAIHYTQRYFYKHGGTSYFVTLCGLDTRKQKRIPEVTTLFGHSDCKKCNKILGKILQEQLNPTP